MSCRSKRQTGQALIMLTLALIAMCGIMGLAVDLGWSYFVKKSAQAAADAAALAAVEAAQKLGFSPPFTCGNATGKIYCTAPTSCPTGAPTGVFANNSNLNSACVYAGLNGFTQGGNVNVVVQADITTPAPTVPNVVVSYWVTVRVNQQVPQLFSAVLGNSTSLVSARATAALTNVIFNASLDLLNREHDPSAGMGTGVDLNIQGGGNVQAPGGMMVSSTLNGSGGAAAHLGDAKSKVTNTPFSWFRGAPGSCTGNGGSNCDTGPASGDWSQPPTYSVPDGKAFQDPTTLGNAKTQPPLDMSSAQNVCPVAGATLTPANVPVACRTSGGTALGPGIYYASVSATNTAATGSPLSFPSGTSTFNNSGTSFGQYIFYGGLIAGQSTITFAPGRYVFAGATGTNPQFTVDNKTVLQDGSTGATQADGGELFIFTRYDYSWAQGTIAGGTTTWNSGSLTSLTPAAITAYGVTNFGYGQGGFTFKGGNNPGTHLDLWGLNPDGTGVPNTGGSNGPLTNYENFLFWQDRANSTITYGPTGNIISSGVGCTNVAPALPQDINNPCQNLPPSSTSPQLNMLATPNSNMHGYLYQPRGAWMYLLGAGNLAGPLRIITGGLSLQGSPTVILTGTSVPITITETALIE